MLEIKYRGALNNKQLNKLVRYLNRFGKSMGSFYEQTLYFDTTIFPEIGDFGTGHARISLKPVGKRIILRLKKGDPAESEREEIAISLSKNESGNLLYILSTLGLKYGYFRPSFRRRFKIKNAIFSIKSQCIMGNHFEIELLKETQIEESGILPILKTVGVSLWTKEQYQKRIHNNIIKFPAINVLESKLF